MNKTTNIGHTHLRFEELDSTNQYAMDYISNNSPMEGTVISTDYQHKGQGQIGRNWYSQKRMNILTSIILRPTFLHPKDQFSFNQAISLGLLAVVNQFSPIKAEIKWPNDIYIGNKKIAGILIQNIINSSTISYATVGIGLNVNQSTFPDHLPNPTSIFLINGKKIHDLDKVLTVLLKQIEIQYNLLRLGHQTSLNQNYLQNLKGLGQRMNFETQDGCSEGKIIGVDQQGKLRVDFNKKIQVFQLGEIKFLDFQ